MKTEKYKFVVYETNSNLRLDTFLTEKLGHAGINLSRSYIASLITNAQVNGKIKKPSYKVLSGDKIEFILPFIQEDKLEYDPNIKIEILFEDCEIIVINKPPGLVVHPAPGNKTGTLVNGILNKIKNPESFPDPLRPGIVHRLDKETSGIIVVCKNINAYNEMVYMFKNRYIKKTYYAIVKSDSLPDSGMINTPIGRSEFNRKKFSVRETGKPALTHYNVISKNNGHSLLEIDLKTGRTHQIRVHLASLNAPVVGDKIYGRKNSNYTTRGMALCAKKIEFPHPAGCIMCSFETGLPMHFTKLLEEIEIFL